MMSLGLWLMLACPSRAALVEVQSPALQELKDIEGASPDKAGGKEAIKAAGNLGFTVKTLTPVGYVEGKSNQPLTPQLPQEDPETAPKPKAGNDRYIFEGKTPIKGVTIYTPKPDPNGDGRTEKPPVKGPIKSSLVYGALGAGLLAAIGGIFFPPLLFLGGLLLGAGAVLWFINRKFAK